MTTGQITVKCPACSTLVATGRHEAIDVRIGALTRTPTLIRFVATLDVQIPHECGPAGA